MKNVNRARRNAGKKARSTQSANAPKSSPGFSLEQLRSLKKTRESITKAILTAHSDDPETALLESHCLAAVDRLQKRISSALDGENVAPLQTALLKIFHDHPAFPWSEMSLAIVLRHEIKTSGEPLRQALNDLANHPEPLVVEVKMFHWQAISREPRQTSFAPANPDKSAASLSERILASWESADMETQIRIGEELRIAMTIIAARLAGKVAPPCTLLLPAIDPCKN